MAASTTAVSAVAPAAAPLVPVVAVAAVGPVSPAADAADSQAVLGPPAAKEAMRLWISAIRFWTAVSPSTCPPLRRCGVGTAR
ncbi:unannotated protein [freshwater metagenome]|uniref:Unannotated protein n=1 Tax=freshwater metagenome TaxID=449393 RepID=A0A6J7IDW4_9ZZZZ